MIRNLGEGIFVAEDEEDEGSAQLKSLHRFMNNIYLPVSLHNLSQAQICVLNRYREERLDKDSQFKHREYSRAIVVNAILEMQPDSVFEVGCGKFPIIQDAPVSRYAAVEIDPEAISPKSDYLIGMETDNGFIAQLQKYQICVALYVFHFKVSDGLINLIDRVLESPGLVLYNVVSDEAEHILSVADRLSERGFCSSIVRHSNLSRKESFFISFRPECAELGKKIENNIRFYLCR